MPALNTTRAENFSQWYQTVVREADMAENSLVRGCMVIKPWGYGIWERMQRLLDDMFKETGHDNAYFPLFIPLKLFEKEADHVDGFAKEMAVVTHARLKQENGKLVLDKPLDEPLVVRPTSETIIAECFSNWIQSYRDLPVLINQWANVVRWEMRTRLFLRTMEFLWQEGHTAHADADCAMRETKRMLEVYRTFIEDNMAVPAILGAKPDYDRFAGAEDTLCLESMMQDGKALQMGTSHYLGQGFAKSANIQFQDKNGQMQYVHTTSWGVSTRMIGGLIMTHADDDGLRLPPRIAPKQIIIVPILRDDADQNAQVLAYGEALLADLKKQSYADEKLRVQLDLRDKPAPDKKWEWIKKGAPLIVEIGPRDVADNKVALKLRTAINDKAQFLPRDQFVAEATTHLQNIHDTLWAEAKGFRDANIRTDVTNFEQFQAHFGEFETDEEGFTSNKGNKFIGFVRAPWCGCGDTTEPMMKKLAVSIRCLPFDQKPVAELGPCVLTGKPATCEVIYARSY